MPNVKSLARIIAEAKMFIQTKRSENEADTNRYRTLWDLISQKPKYESKQLQARPLPELPVSLVPQQSNKPPNKLQYWNTESPRGLSEIVAQIGKHAILAPQARRPQRDVISAWPRNCLATSLSVPLSLPPSLHLPFSALCTHCATAINFEFRAILAPRGNQLGGQKGTKIEREREGDIKRDIGREWEGERANGGRTHKYIDQ